jgi:protein TonB
MYVTFDELDSARGDGRNLQASAAGTPTTAPVPSGGWQPGGGYGARRPRSTTLAAIILLHAGVLTALIRLDVVPVRKASVAPLVVTLMPDRIAPPPASAPPPAAPEQKVEPVAPTPAPAVAPVPVIVPPVAAPVQIATVAVAAPQATATSAPVAAPAPAATAGPAAPVTAPDAFADSLDNPAPRYPVESRRRREEGVVRLRVVVTADGRVREVTVARSSGFDRLDEAALNTVRKWRFRPGMQAGTPVEAIGFLSIPFKLQG